MSIDRDDPRLTAYALGELDETEARAIAAVLAGDAALRSEVEAIRSAAAFLEEGFASASPDTLSAKQRDAIAEGKPVEKMGVVVRFPETRVILAGAVALALVASVLLMFTASDSVRSPDAAEAVTGAAPRTEANRRLESLGYIPSDEALELPEAAWAESPPRAQQRPSPLGAQLRALGYAITPTPDPVADRESYTVHAEQPFMHTADDARSTFSIDVDTASYALIRRFIEQGQQPPAGAVRLEEMINYFGYDYPEPSGEHPFSVTTEVASAPWQPDHRLVRIGLRGRSVAMQDRRASNLVFLIDVSGSMADENKLPLLVRGLSMLVDQLDADDRIAIVVYAGASGMVLPPTRGDQTAVILRALDRLSAGGSTNGGDGIQLAYSIAADNYVRGGDNRVILATDGDFNVGLTDHGSLVRLAEEKARTGVFLSVLGFGQGNYQDSLLEQLADRGNGNYAYIDSSAEAHRVLVEQGTGTLVTIAKDVKIQVVFDPDVVETFRLIGYDNRVLAHRDFDDDERDAGEIGAGHTVTALYEVVSRPGVHPGRLATVRLRYKEPEGRESRLLAVPIVDAGHGYTDASDDLRFAAAVASFGMMLRGSSHATDTSYAQIEALARSGLGADTDGRRAELLRLVRQAQRLGE